MSAIRMRTRLLPACALTALLCATPCGANPAENPAQAPVSRAPSSPQRTLTRDDVELLLREARSAIQQGQLEEADALLNTAEKARIHYPLFHFGPTPASVRREWNKALAAQPRRENQPQNTIPTHGPRNLPLQTRGPEETYDPFLARSQATDGAPATSWTRETQPPRTASLAGPMNNPFAPQGGIAPARHTAVNAAGGAVAQAAWDGEPSSTAGVADAAALQMESGPAWVDKSSSLSMPDVPLPPEISSQSAADNAYGLAPPRRSPQTRAAEAAAPPAQSKEQVLEQLNEARQALDAGNIDLAEQLSRAANSAGVPESQFLPDEDRPSLVAWDIVRARQTEPVTMPALGPALAPQADDSAVAEPGPMAMPAAPGEQSPRVAALEELPAEDLPPPETAPPVAGPPTARETKGSAVAPTAPAELPPPEAGSSPPKPAKPSLLDEADQRQQAIARQLSAEIGKRQSEAQRLRAEDPERALAILHEAQQLVKDSGLAESQQRELLTRIDITLNKTQKYIKDNAAEIELDRANAAVLASRDRDREMQQKLEQKIAESVEEFNRLRDEHRYAEAEIVAKRLYELAPDHPMAQQIYQMAKFIRREMMNRELAHLREENNWEALNDVEKSSFANVGDGRELVFDQTRWDQLVNKRKGSKDRLHKRSERELEIERKLKTPVMLRYQNAPLSQVAEELSELAGVNIHLDPRGLTQEGVGTDTPVSLNLNKEISLQSALNLILAPLHLSYVVKDDVLKITSEQLRDGELVTRTYNVSDLVIPIPNFVPSNNIGLQGLINDAYTAGGYGQRGLGNAGPTVLVNGRGQQNATGTNDQVLAQQFNTGPMTGASPGSVPIGAGPGGMGGGANADFDSLIDLIVSTVSSETWAENGGGEAEIRPFPTNLSLVISQTQAVHEEIADLLEQLRRLQDLQVTIEVRFIRLNDTFFERIGIDFQMNIEDRTHGNADLVPGSGFEPPGRRSTTIGLQRPVNNFPNFTTDLDIPFRQGSFSVAVPPPFAGFDPNSVASFGFAILSDIEAYFLIEAAQGDSRTNILNAPKVTLFNGQQAFVADATQRPFVVGVIPVVGEFAAAQQPVIVVLNEGTMMTIQAVVSDDRRYVRMTIVPFFTQIGDVDEFTFEGSTSSTDSSSSKDDDDDGKNEEKDDSKSETRSGVTVQLPSFSFVSVVTTVSVPDGGTVLLGGIKRLSEGRNEFGVPLLSKIPYINRLFRNIAIGRETDSLMMMVTPRIIIQEEEEERLGIAVP